MDIWTTMLLFGGGLIGGRLGAILPPAMVRSAVIVIGVVMTAVYAWRYWIQ